jgi:glycosyltransferase involved in cell wall biosynthesis
MSSLTIVIPTVNRLALLKKALASVLAQTVPVEIIVSDNGSSDGTETFLPSLDLPNNVRRFRHEPTMTVQRHGAFLVSMIDTEWTVFLSDDDFLEPEFAAGVLELDRAMPQLALIYTGCDMVFGDVALPAAVGPRFEDVPDFCTASWPANATSACVRPLTGRQICAPSDNCRTRS